MDLTTLTKGDRVLTEAGEGIVVDVFPYAGTWKPEDQDDKRRKTRKPRAIVQLDSKPTMDVKVAAASVLEKMA